MGRRFLWRVAAVAAAFFLTMAAMLTIGVALVATAVGIIPAPAAVRLLAIAALAVVLLTVVRAGRRVRRLALTVSDLIGAAGRIEAGDYGVQVAERGPREVRTLARAFNAMSARLASTDRHRRAFVADVTHELRTPLAVIRGQAEAIADGVYPADPAHLAPILDATRSLETLVEALAAMTLTDVVGLTLKREPVEVAVLVHGSLAGFESAAGSAGVGLHAAVAPGTPAVDADPARIRGVLGNLLANAIRATPPGGSVTVGAQPSGETVTFSVRDTGRGIPEALRPHVFERFAKGEDSPGSGLGLAIARDVVHAHGGAIDLVSEMGKGTEVRFTLPVAR